ncbi:hypothetical protein D6R50_19920 [Aeromonas veronii]|uniref:Uncharacterized protein n=1 Tax=Aeromonas veronii TaxID=654 RepID=A0A3A9IF68_AERVE|nr:hypothetical protein [Aeromonas veronii]RKJ85484.1 hypothetical protein D6R50_19920 [Aeromonas veronii]
MEQQDNNGTFTFSLDKPKGFVPKPSTITDKHLVGKIATQIGTGQNAKDSFIWMTITWSFYISTGLSLALFAKSCFVESPDVDVMTHIKDVWSIFTPIITLALGYAFGKGQ